MRTNKRSEEYLEEEKKKVYTGELPKERPLYSSVSETRPAKKVE